MRGNVEGTGEEGSSSTAWGVEVKTQTTEKQEMGRLYDEGKGLEEQFFYHLTKRHD